MTSPTTSLEIARALIRIPSVNPGYDPASSGEIDVANWLSVWASEQGFQLTAQPVLGDRKNIILRLRNGADSPHLHLNGHMDTVAVEGMTIDPFSGAVRDGRLFGRGASDMKGPLACMLEAAVKLRNSPDTWSGTLSIGCMVDEEYRFHGINAMLDQSEAPDFAIVGEPTQFRVVRGCKGCLRFTVTAIGRAAHSSRPNEGSSAISAMAQAITLLNNWFSTKLGKSEHPEFGPSTGSIGLITGGTGVNIVPEKCSIQIDIRLLPGQDGIKTHKEAKFAVEETLGALPGISWEFPEPDLIDPAFEFSADHRLVATVCETLQTNESEVAFYSCDASKIGNRGIPCLVLGPGNISQAHTANEYIEVTDLERGTKVYTAVARALMPA